MQCGLAQNTTKYSIASFIYQLQFSYYYSANVIKR